jgi:hypothetical protein
VHGAAVQPGEATLLHRMASGLRYQCGHQRPGIVVPFVASGRVCILARDAAVPLVEGRAVPNQVGPRTR